MASADFCPITAAVAGCRAINKQWQVEQISPDKNVNCRYTTAAFTISPESVGLRHVVLTCPDDGLVCCFCSSAHSFALRLPPDPSSRRRPCLRLVLVLPCLATVTGFLYRGLAPHKFTPMTGVHQAGGAVKPAHRPRRVRLAWRVARKRRLFDCGGQAVTWRCKSSMDPDGGNH